MDISLYIKGDAGEVLTSSYLRETGMQVVRNLYLRNGDRLAEIDMLAVSSKGVFVVENKNFTGSVHGRYGDRMWRCRSDFDYFDFYNPIKQNAVHCNLVKCLIDTSYAPFVRSAVIFGEWVSKLSVDNKSLKYVFKIEDFFEFLKSLPDVIELNEVNEIYKYFLRFSDASLISRLNFLRENGKGGAD